MRGMGCPEVSSSQRTTEDGGADQPSVASDPAWQRRTTDGGHNRRTTEETDASMADDIGYRSTTDTELGEPPAGGHRHRRTRSRCSTLPATASWAARNHDAACQQYGAAVSAKMQGW